jgi:hypothetical protein
MFASGGGLASIWTTAVAVLVSLMVLSQPSAMAQIGSSKASKPRKAAQGTACGQCLGDLNDDGLLNELDVMVFDIYRAGFPQNLCADFDGDGEVAENDRQYLNLLIFEAEGGACNEACGVVDRSCFVEGEPGEPGSTGCGDPRCCTVVCETDPLCCTVLWDAGCVTVAENVCLPLEPDTRPDAGDCLCEHEFKPPSLDCVYRKDWQTYPGCSDVRCSLLVCEIDPACCRATWRSSTRSTAASSRSCVCAIQATRTASRACP